MKITKFGHCCLLIEEGGLWILTDPGNYTTEQNSVTGIDVVLITHEHQDHLHVDSVKQLLVNNPKVKIFTNQAVGKLLDEAGVSYVLLEHGQNIIERGILFEAFGEQHHVIYRTLPVVQNTGYFIAGKLFYPGDAFVNPQKPVEVLALPVNGPWLAAAGAFDYALELKPQVCFPVHDGNMKRVDTLYRLSTKVLSEAGIKFVPLELGKETEV